MPITRNMRKAAKMEGEPVKPIGVLHTKKPQQTKKPRKKPHHNVLLPICEQLGIPVERMPRYKTISHACGGGGGPLEVSLNVENEEDKAKLYDFLYDEEDDSCLSDAGYNLCEKCGGNTEIGVDWSIYVR
jgi:hypothetical protein